MGQLIDGEWRSEPLPGSNSGEFLRPSSTIRNWVRAGDGEYPALPGRYHLYVARACPWCHRTMIARVAKRLENIVSISFVEPFVFDNGWAFAKPDPLTGVRYIHELYSQADPLFTGRATVGIDLHEPGLVLLKLQQIHEVAGELQALLLQWEQGLQGVGRRSTVIQLEHCFSESYA